MRQLKTLLAFCLLGLICAVGAFGLSACASAAPPAFNGITGDADADGRVTAADARLVLRAGVGLAAPDLARMDADADGSVSAADARLVLRFAVGLETVLPVQSPVGQSEPQTGGKTEKTEKEKQTMRMTVGGTEVGVLWEDNASAAALARLAAEKPLTVQLSPYGGFEQVGPLGTALPREDALTQTAPGDIVLYNGDQIVLFCGSNTWRYTRLGRIQGLDRAALTELLGSGPVSLTLEAAPRAERPFDLTRRTVTLNSGYEMPIVGLGTYALDHDTCVNSVTELLKNGGRLIDTAYMYGNEDAVGEGVRRAMAEYGVPRGEIFVITKIYPSQYGDPEAAIEAALQKLDIGYIDMMLLHHPGENDVNAYKAMERYAAAGKIRSLGLSNWYVKELTEFLPQVSVTPALVQNEIHPYYQERDVVPFIREKGIVVQCWYPLGGRGHTAELLGDAAITAIAKAHGVSAAQVILRWDLQRNIAVIPGSGNPGHIKENLDLFGFSLTDAEMEAIAALDRGEKHDWY